MSVISDFKSSPFELFKQYLGTAIGALADTSYDSLCGVRFSLDDGRVVALVKVGATAITKGLLVQAPAEDTNHQSLAVTVPTAYPATAGLKQVYVTNSSTVLNENQFRGCYAIVNAGTGIGQTLKIAAHAPAANGAKFVLTLEDAILTTLDATSTISLVYNPYINIILAPYTSQTGGVVGATLYNLAASTAATYNATTGAKTAEPIPNYGFIVVKGATGVLSDSDASTVGYPVGRSHATDGAFGTSSLTTSAAIGTSLQTQTSAKTGLIYLNL